MTVIETIKNTNDIEKLRNIARYFANQYEAVQKQRRSRRVLCVNNDYIYDSIRAAARDLNLSFGNISSVLKGKFTDTKGYRFVNYDESWY